MHLALTRAVSVKHFELYSALNQPLFEIYLNSYVETAHSFGQFESPFYPPYEVWHCQSPRHSQSSILH